MRMNDYLREIDDAARSTIDALWVEHRQIKTLEEQHLRELEVDSSPRQAYFEALGRIVEEAERAGVVPDFSAVPEPDRTPLEEARAAAEERIRLRRFSADALSASILQFARQGISIVHGGLRNCPSGRFIGSQGIATVIWQGRNQAIHWEEGDFRSSVADCFERLATEIDDRFRRYRERSMAFDLMLLLGWTDFRYLVQDLKHLEPESLRAPGQQPRH